MTDPSDPDLQPRMMRLALAFLDGPWEEDELFRRGRILLDANRHPRRFPELQTCLRAALAAYRKPPWDRPRELADTMLAALLPDPPRRLLHVTVPERVRVVPTFDVRPLARIGDVERFTGLISTELDWYADLRGLERTVADERLRHYRYRWLPSARRPARLIEAPKDRLRMVQRRILREVLAPVPVSPIAHGYVPGRSALTAADVHVGADVLVQLDLAAFFPSVTFGRVAATYELLGYSPPVARILAGLSTNAAPRAVLRARPLSSSVSISDRWHADRRLAAPHLPQGAPTSPALANLACYRLDQRLAGIARAFDASVTRYADDLTFSGGRRLRSRSTDLVQTVGEVAREQGFHVAAAKTRVVTSAQRQQVLGMVVNSRRSLPRRELDLLEAILTNCVRTGPAEQNRAGHPNFRAHLQGRLAWVAAAAPHKVERLRTIFDRIDWG